MDRGRTRRTAGTFSRVVRGVDPRRTSAPVEDRELVRRLVDGDRLAWDAFVRGHVRLLFAAASRALSGNALGLDPEDVVQAVFEKLWADGRRRLAAFAGRSRLSTWLTAVCHREALDRLRDARRTSLLHANARAA